MSTARAAAAILLAAALTGCGQRHHTPHPRTPGDRPAAGSTCADGTTTSATGRGACSHHGGVA